MRRDTSSVPKNGNYLGRVELGHYGGAYGNENLDVSEYHKLLLTPPQVAHARSFTPTHADSDSPSPYRIADHPLAKDFSLHTGHVEITVPYVSTGTYFVVRA